MKKTTLFVAAMALMAMPLVGCNSSNKAEAANAEKQAPAQVETPAPAAVEAHAVVSVTDDTMFRPTNKVDKVTVLDFNATWCVPCKKLTPAYDQVAEQYGDKVDFYTIDIDKNPQTAQAFGVQSIPHVVILSPNGNVTSFTGLGDLGISDNIPANQYTAVLAKNLSKAIEAALK